MPVRVIPCEFCWEDGVASEAKDSYEVQGGIQIELCNACADGMLSALAHLGVSERDPFPLPNATRSLLEDRAHCANRTH